MDRKSIPALLLAAVGGLASQAHADHIFLQIPGIPGESIVRGYENWIDITSMGEEFSRRTCGGITLAKGLDKASPLLALAAVNADPVAQATVAVRGNGETQVEFLRLVLNDVLVASTTIQSTDANQAVSESVRLLPRSVSITYRQQDSKGGLGPAMTTVITCNSRH